MPVRYFTQEEANSLLADIKPLMAELIDTRGRVVRVGQEIGAVLEDMHSGIGGTALSSLVADFKAIEGLIDRIQSYGCVIKDINVGLIDFLANRNGRDVYLCWRYGEEHIHFYHDVHAGFSGRKPLP